MNHRADIDYIRAVSIICVIVFHAFPIYAPNGYIGVDCFFVVSGFFINQLIIGYKSNSYSNRNTYLIFIINRCNRLLPGLIFLYLLVFYLSWAVLDNGEMIIFKQELLSSLLFIKNFKLSSDIGYFDREIYTKPLMHMWSLSVEMQFYIFYSFILLILNSIKYYQKFLLLFITLVSFISWLFVINFTDYDYFYNPLLRIWEFSIGGLLVYYSNRNASVRDEWMLLFLLTPFLLSIFPIRSSAILVTVPAVIATCCIIYFGKNFRLRLFGNFLSYIGVISYILYLIHWPLLSFLFILTGNDASSILVFFILSLTLLISISLFEFIEKPIRRSFSKTRKFFILLFVYVLLAMTSFNLHAAEFVEAVTQDCVINGIKHSFYRDCVQVSNKKISVVLLGDSKAQSAYRGFFATAPTDIGWVYVGGPGGRDLQYPPPRPLLKINQNSSAPNDGMNTLMNNILNNDNLRTIVFVSAIRNMIMQDVNFRYQKISDSDLKRMQIEAMNLADLVIGNGRNLIIVLDVPWLPDPKECIKRRTKIPIVNKVIDHFSPNSTYLNKHCVLDLNEYNSTRSQYNQIFDLAKNKYKSKFFIVDPVDIFCDINKKICTPFKEGVLLYSYTDHMALYPSLILGARVNNLIHSLNANAVSVPVVK